MDKKNLLKNFKDGLDWILSKDKIYLCHGIEHSYNDIETILRRPDYKSYNRLFWGFLIVERYGVRPPSQYIGIESGDNTTYTSYTKWMKHGTPSQGFEIDGIVFNPDGDKFIGLWPKIQIFRERAELFRNSSDDEKRSELNRWYSKYEEIFVPKMRAVSHKMGTIIERWDDIMDKIK